jgi:hypothetical protein
MSGSGPAATTHDVTERLSWELQAPLTVRPSEFLAFPAPTNWKVEREKMKGVCRQCHGKGWVEDHYTKLDKVVEEYNEIYFKPAKGLIDLLYSIEEELSTSRSRSSTTNSGTTREDGLGWAQP